MATQVRTFKVEHSQSSKSTALVACSADGAPVLQLAVWDWATHGAQSAFQSATKAKGILESAGGKPRY